LMVDDVMVVAYRERRALGRQRQLAESHHALGRPLDAD
jgi:hypothetical protein